MSIKPNMQLMASYNQWMNKSIYESVSQLSHEELTQERKAFFGSILGTLNHNLVGDIIWLKRFAEHFVELSSLEYVRSIAKPAALDSLLYDDFESLRNVRFELDNAIINMMNEVTDEMLTSPLSYKSSNGMAYSKLFGFVLQHFFNHQTHHRGQLTTLLSQTGGDVGATDLILTIPNHIET